MEKIRTKRYTRVLPDQFKDLRDKETDLRKRMVEYMYQSDTSIREIGRRLSVHYLTVRSFLYQETVTSYRILKLVEKFLEEEKDRQKSD